MAENEGQDKKHAPSERKLRRAAESGDVARSNDLPKAAAIVLVTAFGFSAATAIGAALDSWFAASLAMVGTGRLSLARGWAVHLIAEMALLFGLIAVLSLAAGVLCGGWTFSATALMPDFSRLSPAKGLASLFSVSGMAETLKSAAKFIVIGGVGAVSIYGHTAAFVALASSASSPGQAVIALGLHLLLGLCAAILAVAAVDVAVQFWLHRRRHRMSDQEMREEMKDVVGNPYVRQRQRAIARRIARARQMKQLPEASVIITNPTHIAVAIRFRRGVDAAPILLAKGADMLAMEIIKRARGYGIPIVEAPPLARAVHRHVEPDEHIPVALYRACAEVLAYVWRLQLWRSAKDGRERPSLPRLSPIEMGRQDNAAELR